jgi:dUTP pyrophosphatase
MEKRKRGFERIKDCEDAKTPIRSTTKSAGYDFFAYEDGVIHAGQRKAFKTGIKAYMMDDEVLLCFPRSSIGYKHGIRLANGTGVIDADYYNNKTNEGEIQVLFHNTSNEKFKINKDDKLFQGIFIKYLRTDLEETNEKNIRKSGIGSTGK